MALDAQGGQAQGRGGNRSHRDSDRGPPPASPRRGELHSGPTHRAHRTQGSGGSRSARHPAGSGIATNLGLLSTWRLMWISERNCATYWAWVPGTPWRSCWPPRARRRLWATPASVRRRTSRLHPRRRLARARRARAAQGRAQATTAARLVVVPTRRPNRSATSGACRTSATTRRSAARGRSTSCS
jgi:hypothetical protein